LLARRRADDAAAGLAALLALLAEHGDTAGDLIPVAIETPRGLLVACLRATGRRVYRRLPADTELAQAIAVLARAQQDAVWDRTVAHNKLRSHLREYYPAFVAAFTRPEARAVLAAALTAAQLRAILRKAGRRRDIDAEAARLHEAFRTPQSASSPSSSKPWAGKRWPCSARPYAVRKRKCAAVTASLD
jgi:hypothetical protein